MGFSCEYPAMSPPGGIPLVTLPEEKCPYLPGRTMQIRAFRTFRAPSDTYRELMDAGFRRSGLTIYQPACRGCRVCTPIRVPVDSFSPNKSMRRNWRTNADIVVRIEHPNWTEEKAALYDRYLSVCHHRETEPSGDGMWEFLYESPVQSREMVYSDREGKLLGVGIVDICPPVISSVYFYYEPIERHRGLGIYSALREIEFARQNSLKYWYCGYWVEGSRAMEYKAHFKPNELLMPTGDWQAV